MGPVLITEGKLRQTKMYTPSPQCVEANDAEGGDTQQLEVWKWTNKSAVG